MSQNFALNNEVPSDLAAPWICSHYKVHWKCCWNNFLRTYQMHLTLLCIVFQRIHNYKWQTFTIGNLILQKWHKRTKIVDEIEMNSAIPLQFPSIPSNNSNCTAVSSNERWQSPCEQISLLAKSNSVPCTLTNHMTLFSVYCSNRCNNMEIYFIACHADFRV